jgi:hypothetical protein
MITAKPVCYLVNMSESDYINKKNKWLGKVKTWIDARNPDPIVPFCGGIKPFYIYMGPPTHPSRSSSLSRSPFFSLPLTEFFRF